MQTVKFELLIAAALAAACRLAPLNAATLTAVPMQGGMAMPMIAYHANQGRLQVTMPTDVPQLTPLLASNPADSFAPDDPWFDILDPSRQGQSFSRRYGFVMDAASDPLPPNTGIWLRKLSASPALSFYRYSASAPKAWEPIFGTAHTTNALSWSGTMFHPGVTAPPGTNALSATFEAYLADKTTGQEIPGTATGPVVFPFSNVSDGRPLLSITPKRIVTWPAPATNWVLEGTENLTSSNWTTVTNTPTLVDGQPAVALDVSETRKFFRLRRLP